MPLSLLLLLLVLIYNTQANQFLGTVMTYYPNTNNTDGSVMVDLCYKLNFQSCTDLTWQCLTGNCGNESIAVNNVSVDSSGQWCQTEGISTRQVPSNAPFQLWLNGGNWIYNITNRIVSWRAVTLVELRTRSDTGKANASPQTTILPTVRWSFDISWHMRMIALTLTRGAASVETVGLRFHFKKISLTSDDWCQKEGISTRLVPNNTQFQPLFDGGNWVTTINNIQLWRAVTLVELRNRSDTSKANTSPQTTVLPLVRYGNTSLSECNPCTPPSVLNLSSSCTLSFSPNNSSNEGVYAVQLVMEDFPTHTITLTQTNDSQEVKTNSDALSKIPVQFAFSVDPEVPSCTEGLYLPKFLPPTPDNRAQLYTPVNHSLEILIKAETKNTTISELLFSGPYNVTNTTLAAGQYILSWTPSQNEDGESHPCCTPLLCCPGNFQHLQQVHHQ